jgi:hypothetical protein
LAKSGTSIAAHGRPALGQCRLHDHRPVPAANEKAPSGEKFVTPDEFASYATIGKSKGFLLMASSPLTRSSHHAGDDFAKLRAAREAQLKKSA